MQAPKLPSMLGLFRQRKLRGFDYAPRYYDAAEEERKERRLRFSASGTPEGDAAHAEFRDRMRHSWTREGSGRASITRLLVILVLTGAICFIILRAFGLLAPSTWGI